MTSAKEIEEGFDIFFESLGFERVSKFLGDSPPFSNADYISISKKIIIELKVIDKDYLKEGGIINKLHSIVPTPIDTKEDGRGIYKVTRPPSNWPDSLEEPLKRILKKANRQLRDTNEHMLKSQGTGFIVMYLNTFVSLNPIEVSDLVSKILGTHFSSISGYIICSRQPEIFCSSAMNQSLSQELYNIWYSIGGEVGSFIDSTN